MRAHDRHDRSAGEQLTYSEVKERLNASDDDVVRLLHSLSCAKHKVLLKEPSNKTINKMDSFRLNTKFTDRMRRVKVRCHRRTLPCRLLFAAAAM